MGTNPTFVFGRPRNLNPGPPECMGDSSGDVSEEPVKQEKRKKGWRMSCDVGEVTEGLENKL